MELEPIKLTKKLLTEIKPDEIIFGEFAGFGAMGAAGTARFFTLDGDELKFYLAESDPENKNTLSALDDTVRFLQKAEEDELLVGARGGFGNRVFRKKTIKFLRDDDNTQFLYKKGKKTYEIPTSVVGVYNTCASELGEREVTNKMLEKYAKEYQAYMTKTETIFFVVYRDQLKWYDEKHYNWFNCSPMDYYNAIKYIQYLEEDEDLADTFEYYTEKNALEIYRLKYVVDKIGWNRLNHTVAKMIRDKDHDLFARLSREVGQDLFELYTTVETIKPIKPKVGRAEGIKFESLARLSIQDRMGAAGVRAQRMLEIEEMCERPVLVDFNKEEREKIINSIFKMKDRELWEDTAGFGFFIANFLFNEDKWAFSEILPAVVYFLEKLNNSPEDDGTLSEIYWLCSEVVERTGSIISEDKVVQKNYRDLLFKLYWPRVGALWPVLHRREFEFRTSKDKERDFEDAVNYTLGLDDIAERVPEIKQFFDQYIAGKAHLTGKEMPALIQRAFEEKLRTLTPEEKFRMIMEEAPDGDFERYLRFPRTVEDAKVIMDELMRTDDDAWLLAEGRWETIKDIIETPNYKKVGEFILNYLVDNFDKVMKVFAGDLKEGKKSLPVVAQALFEAACDGVSKPEEMKPLLKLYKKVLEYPVEQEDLEFALDETKNRLRILEFQDKTLTPLFKKPFEAKAQNG